MNSFIHLSSFGLIDTHTSSSSTYENTVHRYMHGYADPSIHFQIHPSINLKVHRCMHIYVSRMLLIKRNYFIFSYGSSTRICFDVCQQADLEVVPKMEITTLKK
ncbi:unnamed protein product [Rotaria magnacalcarata]|uniref:Uncharacterized protein n=1 Tax=Rotaria magnacalcarata TaxID=392030 RepID=A0A8S2Y623_9BILA|nr:unnamed protein product [Rotaria magnacalcarata]